MSSEERKNLASKLIADTPTASVLIGFDGFVDDILSAIDKRHDINSYDRIDTIKSYAERIAKLSGVSGSIEIDLQQQKLGGNAPIMANALIAQNWSTNCIAAIGEQDHIHPVFKEFSEKCHGIYPIAEPGNTLAFEFSDGKIMMNQLASLGKVNWNNISDIIGEKNIIELVNKVDLIACVNWAMLPFMNSIYKGIGEILRNGQKNKKVFIDLADVMRRTVVDLREMLGVLSELSKHCELILGLNKSEVFQILDALDISINNDSEKNEDIVELTRKLDLHAIVVHETKQAYIGTRGGDFYLVQGPYEPNPKLTTGAGDNFNAGFCSGWLRSLSWQECLMTGVFTSGYYVRNAKSPQVNELSEFIMNY
ncbi:MAG: hypothetical protein COA79_00480 [Planctomycetota bacterium]|nr:MAG: hypothetical protein COA79_00480 [Planctomycetota bacterium]